MQGLKVSPQHQKGGKGEERKRDKERKEKGGRRKKEKRREGGRERMKPVPVRNHSQFPQALETTNRSYLL